MKKTILSFALLLISGLLIAQTSLSFSAKSGDSELDLTLSDMNTTASANFSVFKQDMAVSYNVTQQKIDYLKVTIKMFPADIYMTLEIGKITGKSIDEVVKVYQANKGKGWGVIAKELGIKPGSKEFHALKGNAKNKKDKLKQKKGNSGSNNGKGNSGGGNKKVK